MRKGLDQRKETFPAVVSAALNTKPDFRPPEEGYAKKKTVSCKKKYVEEIFII